jgi:superfamily II DNA/RNA helicase
VVLHGGLPGKDRKEVLERFKTDPACRVFLSTDAGGTGLNLQNADTVVNLELPWNPAVLEQRIARVHRMGQNRPVRVVNFVTRGTIEEKVLRTIEAKQGLFDGLFTGDDDEIPFAAVNTTGFLDAMREAVGVETGDRRQETGTKTPVPSLSPVPCPLSPASDLWAAAAQLLEGVCALLADTSRPPLADETRERLRAVLRTASGLLDAK